MLPDVKNPRKSKKSIRKSKKSIDPEWISYMLGIFIIINYYAQ